MGRVGRFERRLQGMVGDAFARVFGGSVVPQEVTGAAQREAEDHIESSPGGRLLAPNRYTVLLSPSRSRSHRRRRRGAGRQRRSRNAVARATRRPGVGHLRRGRSLPGALRGAAHGTVPHPLVRGPRRFPPGRHPSTRRRRSTHEPATGPPRGERAVRLRPWRPRLRTADVRPPGLRPAPRRVTTRASPRATASRATRSRATASRASRRHGHGQPGYDQGYPQQGYAAAAGLRPGRPAAATAASRATTRATASRATRRLRRRPAGLRAARLRPAAATTRRLRPAGRLPAALRPGLRRRVRPHQQGYGQQPGYGQQQGGWGGYPQQLTASLSLDDGSGRTLRAHQGTHVIGRGQDSAVPAARHRRVAPPPGDQLGRSARDAVRPRVHQRHHGQRQPGADLAAQRRRRDPGRALQPGVPHPVSRGR